MTDVKARGADRFSGLLPILESLHRRPLNHVLVKGYHRELVVVCDIGRQTELIASASIDTDLG